MALRYRFLLLGVALLSVFLAFNSLSMFPFPKDDILSEKNKEFSGVLRLWISEEDSPSAKGLSAWLKSESTRFEKKYDGVFVQITPVSKETLSSFSYAAELPPDMIVFSPGILTSAQGLVPVQVSSDLREEFNSYESGYCTPITMGASFWAIRKGVSPPLTGKTLLFEKERAQSALYALKSDLAETKTPGARYGVDLGLPIYDNESPETKSESPGAIIPGKDSKISDNACAYFINGEGDAAFLSHKALVSLMNASSAPEFEIAITEEFYSDQLALFAVTETGANGAKEICERFLRHLLSDDAQKRLESTKAFSVTNAQIYAGKARYQEIEMLLSSMKILPAPAFSDHKQAAQDTLTAIIRGETALDSVFSFSNQF